jgi:hypothetical protein
MSEEEEPVKESWDNRPVIFLLYLVLKMMFFSPKKKDSSWRPYFGDEAKCYVKTSWLLTQLTSGRNLVFWGILGSLFFSFFLKNWSPAMYQGP